MACDKFLTFNNGVKMPALGIGTWQVSNVVIIHKKYIDKYKY